MTLAYDSNPQIDSRTLRAFGATPDVVDVAGRLVTVTGPGLDHEYLPLPHHDPVS